MILNKLFWEIKLEPQLVFHTQENLVNFVKDILNRVRLYDNIPELESKGSAKQGQGLKILTTNQMLNRLPISLVQLKAGDNWEKHKNEIRQLLYSLYRSKKSTKTIYNNLINIFSKWKQPLWALKIVRQTIRTNLFINLLKNLIWKTQMKTLHWLI